MAGKSSTPLGPQEKVELVFHQTNRFELSNSLLIYYHKKSEIFKLKISLLIKLNSFS